MLTYCQGTFDLVLKDLRSMFSTSCVDAIVASLERHDVLTAYEVRRELVNDPESLSFKYR